MGQVLLAIDQGTTGTTALLMSPEGATLAKANSELPQHYPRSGWVEHDPEEIWASVLESVSEALTASGIRPDDVGAVGIANQRETTLLWERSTGRPVSRALVWQDRRTTDICRRWIEAGHATPVRETTGLVIDPYFSATKIRWLLDADSAVRRMADTGRLAFGTIDSFLVMRLLGGHRDEHHVTDITNASRTLLMDIRRGQWDASLGSLFGIPRALLPRIVASAEVVGHTRGVPGLPDGIPVAGIAGDQHAALFGQGCLHRGDAKCTYGTGAFVLVNTGTDLVQSGSGLLTTVAWQVGGEVVYALEGSCFIAGAAVQWLRDGLGIVSSSGDVESLAAQVVDSDGVVFVPALTGLGAPHWDPDARGLITGLTRRTTAAHLARASLDAIAFQVGDLVRAMDTDLAAPISRLRVDGGAAANDLLMTLQSDLTGVSVERPTELETTARGAALLAGVGAGILKSASHAAQMISIDQTFNPQLGENERLVRLAQWQDAVRRTRTVAGGD